MKRPFTLRLLSAVTLATLATAPAGAVVEIQSLVRQYDDGDTTVTSPSLGGSFTLNREQQKVSFGFATDILTSASSDVVSYSSRGEITDNRKEFNLGFESLVPNGTLGLYYIQSDEVDYHSKIVSASGSREFFQKNLTVGIGFSNGSDNIESRADSTFSEPMNHQTYSLSLSQVISRKSILQFLYDFRVENGFTMSPYRQAKLRSEDGSISTRGENHPRTRNRNAVALKYNYHYSPLSLSLATTYRFYFDSWGVHSNTIEERISHEFNRKFSLTGIVRYYMQEKARFYQDFYPEDPGPFYTGNNTLATYNSILGGVRPTWNVTDKLGIYTKYEYYIQNYKNATAIGSKINDPSDDKKLETKAHVYGIGFFAKF